MLQKKSFKIISVFVAVIIAFSCFCITASAQGSQDFPINYLDLFEITSLHIDELASSNSIEGNVDPDNITTSLVEYNGVQAIHFSLYLPAVDRTDGNLIYLRFKLLHGESTETQWNDLAFDLVWNSAYGFFGNKTTQFDAARFYVGGGSNFYDATRLNPGDVDFTLPASTNGNYNVRGVHFDFHESPANTVTSMYLCYWGMGIPVTGEIDFYITNVDLKYGSIATRDIIANQNENTDKIIANQDENTDKILNAGSDTPQPDFDSANGQLDDTTAQMESIEGQYKIDETATQDSLSEGISFLSGTNMQYASIQVKTWIEEFSEDNLVITGFLVACMCLGLCFWVIGRKAGTG